MNKRYIWQLLLFAGVLLLLNFFFQLHISIIGSLLLTLGLNFAFNLFRKR